MSYQLCVKMPVSTWCYIPTSLPPKPSSIFYYPKLNFQALDTKRSVASLGKGDFLNITISFLSSKFSVFQLYVGMVSHMQALVTLSSTIPIQNTWIFTTESIWVLAACSWGSNVEIPTFLFSFTSKSVSVTCYHTFFADPFLYSNCSVFPGFSSFIGG